LPLCAFDTNIFAYAAAIGESAADRPKVAIAEALLASMLPNEPLVVPVQVCFELHHLLVRKRRFAPDEAALLVCEYTDGAVIVSSDQAVLEAAFDLAGRHRLQTFAAVILASAARAGCEILYSEDMQHGFEWSGVTVINPFR
jgi:predicted nucleic acid-binding protein